MSRQRKGYLRTEIRWQESEIHSLHIKWLKNPLFHYLFSPWVCGSQTAEHKSWCRPCWNINKATSTRGRNSACSVRIFFFFFLDVGWQPGWWKEKPKRITALQQQKRKLGFRKCYPCASLQICKEWMLGWRWVGWWIMKVPIPFRRPQRPEA